MSKDPIDLLERAVIATEREPTAEEIAAWKAEKAAAVAAREKHAAHMDRAELRAVEQLAIAERQAAALERIAVAVEALARAKMPVYVVPFESDPPQTWGGPVTSLPEHGNGV